MRIPTARYAFMMLIRARVKRLRKRLRIKMKKEYREDIAHLFFPVFYIFFLRNPDTSVEWLVGARFTRKKLLGAKNPYWHISFTWLFIVMVMAYVIWHEFLIWTNIKYSLLQAKTRNKNKFQGNRVRYCVLWKNKKNTELRSRWLKIQW